MAAPEPTPAEGTPRARILVCDDSATMRALLRSLLAPAYDVLLTATAEEALERAPAYAPDLILSDLLLPGMTGSALCQAVRAVPSLAAVPFVLVTTLSGADARADGLEAGAQDYIAKPIRERELLARVASLVRLRRLHAELEERTRALEDANRELRGAREELVRAERLAAVGALAAGLAHEINNPLSYIKAGASAFTALLREVEIAAAEALGRAPDSPALRQRIGDAIEEAGDVARSLADGSGRLERIAADLRVVSAPTRPTEELCDPAEAIDAAWTLARSRFAAALPRLELAVEPGPPVRGGHALLAQALLPLLEHAVSASGPGGRVAVRLVQHRTGVEILIADSGPGLSPRLLARVFDPGGPPRPDGSPGGLGLAVAHGIVRGLGGDVAAAAEPGAGTTFRVQLPRGAPVPANTKGKLPEQLPLA